MSFQRYSESFKEWLEVINSSEGSIQRMPRQLQEFFAWMESQNVMSLQQITRPHVSAFYEYLKYTRKTQHGDTFLKPKTLNGYIRCLKLFAHYLEETQQGYLPVNLLYERGESLIRQILSSEEVQRLYQATREDHYGIRERAILSLYYGCGLRSSEGIALNLEDVMLEQRMIYVRKGKGYKERYVPFIQRQKEDFEHYLKQSRPRLLMSRNENGKNENGNKNNNTTGNAFLIGHQGRRISYGILLKTLKHLQERTGDEALQQKRIGLHALRHSIATHLMQRGMKFDYISEFLGHQLLSSTQVYTHLAHEHDYAIS